MAYSRTSVTKSNRIVVKIGSALLTSMKTPEAAFQKFANEICTLREQGRRVSLVSSGAIAQGLNIMGYKKRPAGLAQAQALAALGQPALMNQWAKAFAPTPVAQFLLSKYDVTNPTSFFNARRALRALEDKDVVPVGNENDTVSTDEIKIGDNDNLAASVSMVSNADLMIILTQVDGLYTSNPEKDPNAKLITTITSSQMEYARKCSGVASDDGLGTGGFYTKLQAVQLAFTHDIPVIIANGKIQNILPRLMEGEEIGTLFVPPEGSTRYKWISEYWPIEGRVVVRSELADKVLKAPTAIWMQDIVDVQGNFLRGHCVEIVHERDNKIMGRGLVGYTSCEIQRLHGKPEEQVLADLGSKHYDDHILHPDDYICSTW